MIAIGNRKFVLELDSETLYGDGTFDKVPNIFFQLHMACENRKFLSTLHICVAAEEGHSNISQNAANKKNIVPSLNL